MFLRDISIVFLFPVHVKFPSNLSTIEVIRNFYSNVIVNLVRKFEKLCLHNGKPHLTAKVYLELEIRNSQWARGLEYEMGLKKRPPWD